MIESVSEITVRYSETDMMGIVYHANYLTWLEIGRTEMLRECGLPYSEMEEQGILLPVLSININYCKPARYDEVITITTRMNEKPFVKIALEYEIHRGKELLSTASSTHAFMNRDAHPIKTPRFFLDTISKEFA